MPSQITKYMLSVDGAQVAQGSFCIKWTQAISLDFDKKYLFQMNRFVAILMLVAGSAMANVSQNQPQGSSGSSSSGIVTQYAEARESTFVAPDSSWDPSYSSAPFASKCPKALWV